MVGTLYTLAEVAKITGFSMSYLYKAISKDLISYYKPTEGKVFIDSSDLNAFLRRGRHTCPADIVRHSKQKKL